MRSVKLAALAATGVLALAGCATGNPQAAAYVDGHAIPQAEVDSVAHAVTTAGAAESGTIAQGLVVQILIQNEIAKTVANDTKFTVTDAQREQLLTSSPALTAIAKDPAAAGFVNDYTETYLLLQTDAGKQAFNDRFVKTDIVVNPRFGTWDPKQPGLVDGTAGGSISELAPLKQG